MTVISRKVPLLDLAAQHRQIRDETTAALLRVVDSQKFILGEEVKLLEQETARYCGAQFAVGCASGSDALFLALLAIGIEPGDRVLTTPYTFFATAGAIHRAGAVPVFADIDPGTFNIDPAEVARAVAANPRLKAIIPVHLFGACADMDPIVELARHHGIAVIEDAAQAIGSEYKGRRAGTLAGIACFSFFPSKNLGGYGDGGLLTTGQPALAEKLTALRTHGSLKKYYHKWVGVNSRLDAIQAAVLRVKLRYLDGWTEGRQRNAAFYASRLAALGVPVSFPVPPAHTTRHIYNQFVIAGERRDQLQAFLAQEGIGTEIYYPLPMHLQECFEHLGYRRGDFPVSERLAQSSLALPVYPELATDDLEHVCQALVRFYTA